MTISLPKTPSFRLDGRRALVTGAGRGIGLAAAAALGEAGAEVCLISRTGSEIEEAAEAIRAAGRTADTGSGYSGNRCHAGRNYGTRAVRYTDQ